MDNYYTNYRKSLEKTLAGLEVTEQSGTRLRDDEGFAALIETSSKIRDSGHRQYFVGSGASAAFANHMALDWTKNGGVPTHSFADSALLTAVGNDLGFEEVFSEPLSWYGQEGDLLTTISSSGNSPNVVKAIGSARKMGMIVVTFSGLKADNQSRQLGDLNFYVPAKTYGIVECAHQVLLHIWLDRFMGIVEWEKTEVQNMRKGEF